MDRLAWLKPIRRTDGMCPSVACCPSELLREKQSMIEHKNTQGKLRIILLTVALSCHPAAGLAQAAGTDGNSVADGVAVLKQLLQESRDRLRAYEWTETTVVRLKGDE